MIHLEVQDFEQNMLVQYFFFLLVLSVGESLGWFVHASIVSMVI